METPQLGRLSEYFVQLPDPRGDRTTRHLLLDMVVIAVCAVITGLQGYEDWVGLQTVAMAEVWRTQGDAVSYERRDYISSLGLYAKQRAESVRGYWANENALHRVLDIAFREGDCRIRKRHASENFAMLRHLNQST